EGPGMAEAITGRVAEIEVLDAFLGDRAVEPRSILIEGSPGIGKTTLLRGLLRSAAEQGYAVAVCQPTRSEMALSYAGLVALLAELGPDVVDSLPAPQARMLRTVARVEDGATPVDRLSVSLATVAAVRAVSVEQPLVVAVDDAQWLDHPTARVLAFLSRRLVGTATRVVMVHSLGAPPMLRGAARAAGTDEAVDWDDELARAM